MPASKLTLRALLAVAGLTIAAATCPDGESVMKYPGYDVQPGSHIKRVSGLKVGACHSLCVNTDGCNSAVVFTYRSAAPVCFLKTAGVDARVRPDSSASLESLMGRFVVIGCAPEEPAVPPAPPAACPEGTTYKSFSGFDVDVGGNLGARPGLSSGECRDLCATTSGCKSTVLLSYPRGPDKCFLKSSSVDERVPVSQGSRIVSSGCAGPDVVPPVVPKGPVCDGTTCVGRNKRCGGGNMEYTAGCCDAGFACFALDGSNFAQCRNPSDLPARFLPDPVDCGTYGDLGTLGAYA